MQKLQRNKIKNVVIIIKTSTKTHIRPQSNIIGIDRNNILRTILIISEYLLSSSDPAGMMDAHPRTYRSNRSKLPRRQLYKRQQRNDSPNSLFPFFPFLRDHHRHSHTVTHPLHILTTNHYTFLIVSGGCICRQNMVPLSVVLLGFFLSILDSLLSSPSLSLSSVVSLLFISIYILQRAMYLYIYANTAESIFIITYTMT